MLFRVILALRPSSTRTKLVRMLKNSDCLVTVLSSKEQAWDHLVGKSADMLVIHRSLFEGSFEDGIRRIRETPDTPSVVIMCDRENPGERAYLLAIGCDSILSSKLPAEDVMDVLRTILKQREEMVLVSQTEAVRAVKPQLSDFSSQSPSMRTFMDTVQRVINKEAPLLILGETGTGKEWLARSIHAESPRRAGPFIAVNCGALPEPLLESELFGHEEGAFTGASHARRGWFELAHRGTVFLDEIGEMPYPLQVKLLRVLQDHEIQRLGSERSIRIDVRVMAATNCDLEEAVKEKRFRQDLYYRLSVMELALPPLRERKEDIPDIAKSYIDYFRVRINSLVDGISDAAMKALCSYSWPGNVRELINVIERAMILCDREEIDLEHLPESVSGHTAPMPIVSEADTQKGMYLALPEGWYDKPLAEAREDLLREFERTYLTMVLRKTNGRINQAAEWAGMDPRSLYDKMKRHRLRKEDFRKGQDDDK